MTGLDRDSIEMREVSPLACRLGVGHGQALMASGRFPHIAALASESEAPDSATPVQLGAQFEVGLAALIDGIGRHYGITV